MARAIVGATVALFPALVVLVFVLSLVVGLVDVLETLISFDLISVVSSFFLRVSVITLVLDTGLGILPKGVEKRVEPAPLVNAVTSTLGDKVGISVIA